MKIVTIIGARPQFIKAAAVSRAIAVYNSAHPEMPICEVIVHTGQHYDANMSQIFFDELQIPRPDYNLEIGSGSHGTMTGSMLAKIEDVLRSEAPDFLLVYGDTNSTLAGSLAAVKLHIPSVHVEAGLRSYNRHMPEEINRILADHTANLLLCPNQLGVDNLFREGIGGGVTDRFDFNSQRVYLVGDVMYDSVLFNAKLAEEKSHVLDDLDLKGKAYALATLHRAENTDDDARLRMIFQAFTSIAADGMPIVLPLHPRTRKRLDEASIEVAVPGLRIIEPVGYLDMLCLERSASAILTDSGGVQKEAYFMQVPCITLRDQTEWVETVALGWNRIVGADTEAILATYSQVRDRHEGGPPFGSSVDIGGNEQPYGDGCAAEKIVDILVNVGHEFLADTVNRSL